MVVGERRLQGAALTTASLIPLALPPPTGRPPAATAPYQLVTNEKVKVVAAAGPRKAQERDLDRRGAQGKDVVPVPVRDAVEVDQDVDAVVSYALCSRDRLDPAQVHKGVHAGCNRRTPRVVVFPQRSDPCRVGKRLERA